MSFHVFSKGTIDSFFSPSKPFLTCGSFANLRHDSSATSLRVLQSRPRRSVSDDMLTLSAAVRVAVLVKVFLVDPEAARQRTLLRGELLEGFSVRHGSENYRTIWA